MVARKSATPQARKVVAATVRNCDGVRNPKSRKIVNGTPIPITITPTIKRGPDMARYCMRVYWFAPVRARGWDELGLRVDHRSKQFRREVIFLRLVVDDSAERNLFLEKALFHLRGDVYDGSGSLGHLQRGRSHRRRHILHGTCDAGGDPSADLSRDLLRGCQIVRDLPMGARRD